MGQLFLLHVHIYGGRDFECRERRQREWGWPPSVKLPTDFIISSIKFEEVNIIGFFTK